MTQALSAQLYIEGEFRPAKSGDTFTVLNPADESVVGEAAEATAEDVIAAVSAARSAFDTGNWRFDADLRKHCMTQLQAGLREKAGLLKEVQVAEAGIPAMMNGGIDGVIDDMSFAMNLVDTFPWETDFPAHQAFGMSSRRRVRYEPYGVVAAITPWNAPTILNLWKIVPALCSGNTVVLKTAPETPLAGALIAQVVDECTDIPAGVFNLISSSDNAIGGDVLTGDLGVDMYHFTGSTAVGERIAARAAVGVRKVVLELGGKSANVVLPDADLDLSLPMSVLMCMQCAGQGCTLATRMVVHGDIYDEVVERLISIARQVPFGDPNDASTVVGPIIRRNQLDRIAGLVDRARRDGARVLVGGELPGNDEPGFWYPPTLIAEVDENSEIAQTEVFGPVLSVIKYQGGDDEAIRIANNTKYGLSGYIQSRDAERAFHIAGKLRTGTVNINNSSWFAPDTPFGGFGASGLGREHGIDGWKEFVQAKTIASPA